MSPSDRLVTSNLMQKLVLKHRHKKMTGHQGQRDQHKVRKPLRQRKQPLQRITNTRALNSPIKHSGLGSSSSHKTMQSTLAFSALQYQRPDVVSKHLMGPLTLVKEPVVTFHNSKNSKSKALYFVATGGSQNKSQECKEKDEEWLEKLQDTSKTTSGVTTTTFALADGPPNHELFDFFLNQQFCSSELRLSILTDQLLAMVAQVKSDIMKPGFLLNAYILLQGGGVNEIFYWCKTLMANTPTFFRSLELFDRFGLLFNEEMTEPFRQMDAQGKLESKKRMRLQKPLRICSCIMLASKIHSDLNTPTITLDRVKAALLQQRHAFSLQAIAESELRVFRVLKYATHWVTPFDLTEQMISMIDLPAENLPRFYNNAMLYLKFCYLKHREFYKKVENIHRNEWSKSPELSSEDFKRLVEHNTPLRSAVIVTATGFHIGEQFHRQVAKLLSNLISESEYVLQGMALLLCDMAGVLEI